MFTGSRDVVGRRHIVAVLVLLSMLGASCSTSGDPRDVNGLATVCLPKVPDSADEVCVDYYESGVVDVRAVGLAPNSPVRVVNDRGEKTSMLSIGDGTLTNELTTIAADRPLLVEATWSDGTPVVLATN